MTLSDVINKRIYRHLLVLGIASLYNIISLVCIEVWYIHLDGQFFLKIPGGVFSRGLCVIILVELSLIATDAFMSLFKHWHEKILSLVLIVIILSLFNLFISDYAATIYDNTLKNIEDAYWRVVASFILVTATSSLTYIALSFASDYRHEQEAREAAEICADDLKKAERLARLDRLLTQSDNHFIFNSLSTLSGLIRQAPEKAEEVVSKFSGMYRFFLTTGTRHFIPLSSEITFLTDYISILSIRYPDIVIDIDKKGLMHGDCYILPASMVMLVSNAVKHNSHNQESKLTIRVSSDSEWFTVSNNLVPIKNNEPSSGIGLKNLGERYRILTGKDIIVKNDGRTFTVFLPIIYMEDISNESIDNRG